MCFGAVMVGTGYILNFSRQKNFGLRCSRCFCTAWFQDNFKSNSTKRPPQGVRFTNSRTIFLVFTNSRTTEELRVMSVICPFTNHKSRIYWYSRIHERYYVESRITNEIVFTNSRTKKCQFPPSCTPLGGGVPYKQRILTFLSTEVSELKQLHSPTNSHIKNFGTSHQISGMDCRSTSIVHFLHYLWDLKSWKCVIYYRYNGYNGYDKGPVKILPGPRLRFEKRLVWKEVSPLSFLVEKISVLYCFPKKLFAPLF